MPAQGVEDPPIALGHAGVAELQAAQAIALVRVGTGQVERQAGRTTGVALTLPGGGQRALQRRQIRPIGAAVGQIDVHIAGLFLERKVLRAVQRQREHRRVVAEDRRRAIALVHIEIDHPDPQQAAGQRLQAVHLGLHQARSHRHIVENAVARAFLSRGVVGAARQLRGHALGQRGARGSDRGAHRPPAAHHHALAPGKADLALRRGRQRALRDRVDVVGRVHQRQFTIAGRIGLGRAKAGAFGLHPVAQQFVLRHREAVRRRQVN